MYWNTLQCTTVLNIFLTGLKTRFKQVLFELKDKFFQSTRTFKSKIDLNNLTFSIARFNKKQRSFIRARFPTKFVLNFLYLKNPIKNKDTLQNFLKCFFHIKNLEKLKLLKKIFFFFWGGGWMFFLSHLPSLESYWFGSTCDHGSPAFKGVIRGMSFKQTFPPTCYPWYV